MNFCPKQISKKLESLGCKSESNFYWLTDTVATYCYEGTALNQRQYFTDPVICFTYQDIIGPSKQAKKNAKLIFGKKTQKMEMFNAWSDWEEWELQRYYLINTNEKDFWHDIEEKVKLKRKILD